MHHWVALNCHWVALVLPTSCVEIYCGLPRTEVYVVMSFKFYFEQRFSIDVPLKYFLHKVYNPYTFGSSSQVSQFTGGITENTTFDNCITFFP